MLYLKSELTIALNRLPCLPECKYVIAINGHDHPEHFAVTTESYASNLLPIRPQLFTNKHTARETRNKVKTPSQPDIH